MHRKPAHFFLSVFTAAVIALPACGGSKGPSPSQGGDEILCPDGSANPGATIRTVNCSTVIQYDGDEFESSLNVKGLAQAGIKNVDTVLREVSQAANDAQIQFTQTCELYNGCNLTSAEYRERLDQAQAHFRAIREKVALLEASGGNPEVLRKTVTELYVETVPEERIAAQSLSLEFSIQGKSGDGAARVVQEGDTLRTGDQVVVGVRTSQDAYVYLFQKKTSGVLDVLFPNPQITKAQNPLRAGQLMRIPPQGQVFTLDDQDLGEETVYIAASRHALTDLEAALTQSSAGGTPATQKVGQAMSSLFDEAAPECAEKSRGLEVTEKSGCGSMTRGLTPQKSSAGDDFFSDQASLRGRTAPGDDVLIRTFRFRHEN